MRRTSTLLISTLLLCACAPDKGAPHLARGNVLVNNGKRAQAATNLYVLLSRGNLAARAGDRKAALADYERAVHLKSDNVPALYQYGLALLEDGQVPEAMATFDRLLRVSPQSPQGYYGRARVLAAQGDGKRAGEALSEAVRRVEPDARERLAEQGLKGEALERAVREATDRSTAQ